MNRADTPPDDKTASLRAKARDCVTRAVRRLRGSRAASYVSLAALAVCTGLLSLLLGAGYYGLPLFRLYFDSPAIIALNILPTVLLVFFLYFAAGRAWLAFSVPSAVIFLLSFINYFKLQLRGSPFVLSDILHAGEALTIAGAFAIDWNWKLTLSLAFFTCGTAWCALCLRAKPGVKLRAAVAPAIAAFSAVMYAGVYANDNIYESLELQDDLYVTHHRPFVGRGFLYPFLHGVKNAFPKKPDGYSDAMAEALLASFAYDDIPAERRVNVISVMLESYADFTRFDRVVFKEDVYARWRELQRESVHGNLIVNTFAGGTIDTERLFLTGFRTLPDIRRRTDSYVWYLREQGYYTEGFHAGDEWFYNRAAVHEHLGFHDYHFLQSFEGSTQWDYYFFPMVRELYADRDASVPYFSHNLSYQNHGAYPDDANNYGEIIERDGLSDRAYYILSNYLGGIQDTTERLYDFIGLFRGDPEPVVILLYGDHIPWLGNNGVIYDELGIGISAQTEESFYNRYAVPYIIWANDAAKDALENDFTGSGGDISPGFLMNLLFELCGWGGDEYMKLTNELFQSVTVMNTSALYFIEDGKLTVYITPEAARLYNHFLIAEYYRQRHFYGDAR